MSLTPAQSLSLKTVMETVFIFHSVAMGVIKMSPSSHLFGLIPNVTSLDSTSPANYGRGSGVFHSSGQHPFNDGMGKWLPHSLAVP